MKAMNKFKYTIRIATLGMLMLFGFSSCQDWLTIYPQTQIVEENFWEDRNDLDGVRYACYQKMCGTIEKMAMWGDLRSDSYVLSVAATDNRVKDMVNLYTEIREGRIDRDSAENYFEWSGFYTTINYCNKVLSHGEEVLARDKQFTRIEWNQMKAEITALRALNYFYLIRAFKDIPYTTKVINKDTEVEYFGLTNQLVVLDSLIADVEAIKGKATNRFPSLKDTKGMITNTAIYALLSDMYLWRASLREGRFGKEATDEVVINNLPGESYTVTHSVRGDYQLCADYADEAMRALAQQTLQNNQGFGASISDKLSYGLENVALYKNNFENFTSGVQLTAFEKIYTAGNSDESIFELQFGASDNRKNEMVNDKWGYNERVLLAVSDAALDKALGDQKKYDARTWFSGWQRVRNLNGASMTSTLPATYCFKYYTVEPTNYSSGRINEMWITASSTSYHNWIVYRLSDVMLQKAEALAALSNSKTDAYAKSALRIVNALNRRWYCTDLDNSVKGTPSENVMDDNGAKFFEKATPATIGNIATASSIEQAVMNERQIEFIGEGKRWFDLVRYAERHAGGESGQGTDVRESTEEKHVNSGVDGVKSMVDTFMGSSFSSAQCSGLKNHLQNRYGLYNIIYYMEIKASVDANGIQHIEQNPVWNKSKHD